MKTISFNELIKESIVCFFSVRPELDKTRVFQFSEEFIQDSGEYLKTLILKDIDIKKYLPEIKGIFALNGLVFHYEKVGELINTTVGWATKMDEYCLLDMDFLSSDLTKKLRVGGWKINKFINKVGLTDDEIKEGYGLIKAVLFTFLTFLTLSEDKLKYVDFKPNERKGSKKFGNLVQNNTNFRITHVKSDWNTTKIYNGITKVRGHFRLQPCGKGRNDVKLIFIEEHVKTLYVKKSVKDSILN